MASWMVGRQCLVALSVAPAKDFKGCSTHTSTMEHLKASASNLYRSTVFGLANQPRELTDLGSCMGSPTSEVALQALRARDIAVVGVFSSGVTSSEHTVQSEQREADNMLLMMVLLLLLMWPWVVPLMLMMLQLLVVLLMLLLLMLRLVLLILSLVSDTTTRGNITTYVVQWGLQLLVSCGSALVQPGVN